MTIDEFETYGVERMDGEAIGSFLTAQRVGVLGLPTDRLPYMIPISYAFDGESNLYFSYLVGETSQKATLTEETAVASFLVFDAHSEYMWRSVALEGTLSPVPEDEVDSLVDSMEGLWRPDALERASEVEDSRLYRLEIQNRTGVKHFVTPPGMDPEESDG